MTEAVKKEGFWNFTTRFSDHNEFWYWKGELSDEVCSNIIAAGADEWEMGIVLERGEEVEETPAKYSTNDLYRKCKVAWLNDDWLFNLVSEYGTAANDVAGWKYDLRGLEAMQLTRYCEGEYYNPHKDSLGSHHNVIHCPDNEYLHGHARKLSVVITLNNDFEGGNLVFRDHPNHPEFESRGGSIVVFPSFLTHEVTPITKGIRYSLVCWFVGPPFK